MPLPLPTILRQPKLSAEDILRKYMTEVVRKKQRESVNLRSTGLRNESQKQGYFEPAPSRVRVRDFARELGSLAKRGASFLTESEQKFGQTLGDALAVMSKDVKDAQKAQVALDNMNLKVAKVIIAAKKKGKDTSRLEEFYKKNTGRVFDISEVVPSTKKSARQIFGEGVGVAATIAAFGTYGQAAKGAKTGKLLTRSTIKANKAMMGKSGKILRPELAKRRLGDIAQKVNIELIGKGGVTTKAAKAVANINPSKINDPIHFARLVKKELAKFGLVKNKKILIGLRQTASDFRVIQQFAKPIYTKGKSSLTASKVFLRNFKEAGKVGVGIGAGFGLSEALKNDQDLIGLNKIYGKEIYNIKKIKQTVKNDKILPQLKKIDSVVKNIFNNELDSITDKQISELKKINTNLKGSLQETIAKKSGQLKSALQHLVGVGMGSGNKRFINLPAVILGGIVGGGLIHMLNSTWWPTLNAVRQYDLANKLIQSTQQEIGVVLGIFSRQGIKAVNKFLEGKSLKGLRIRQAPKKETIKAPFRFDGLDVISGKTETLAQIGKKYKIVPGIHKGLVKLRPTDARVSQKGRSSMLQALYDYDTGLAEDYMFRFQDGVLIDVQPHRPRRKVKTQTPEFYRERYINKLRNNNQ